MKNRLKALRKALDLTQASFAERIGTKQNTVATYEMGRNNPSDPVIRSICKEFSVNEEWLRTGSGEMFAPDTSDELEALAKKYHLVRGMQVLIEKLVNLQPKDQEVLINLVSETAAGIESMKEAGADPNLSDFPEASYEMSIDEKVAAYRAALELEEKAAEKSEVS